MKTINWRVTAIASQDGDDEFYVRANDILQTILDMKLSDREKLAVLEIFLADLANEILDNQEELAKIVENLPG